MDLISSVVAVEVVLVVAMVVVAIVVVVPVIVVAVMVLSGWVTWCQGEYGGGGFLSDGLLVQCIVHSQCLGGVCNTIDKLLIDPTWK